MPAYEVAVVYAGLGKEAQAYTWIEKACEERSGWIVYLKVDPRLDNLHADPRFLNLLRRINLPR